MNKYLPSYNKHTGIWTEIDAITKKITKKWFLIFLPNTDSLQQVEEYVRGCTWWLKKAKTIKHV